MKKIRYFLLLCVTILGVAACQKDDKVYYTAGEAKMDAPAVAERGASIQFTDSSIPTKGTSIVKWEWSFGVDKESISTEQNPQYTYKVEGEYEVRLVITDNNGRTASVTAEIVINIPYQDIAHADFVISTDKPMINTPLVFTDKSVASKNATIIKWEWNFGENDEAISDKQNPIYSYTTSGSFNVTLKITDSADSTSTKIINVIVKDPAELVSLKWKSTVLASLNSGISPAMSPDCSTLYMWSNSTGGSVYDVKLKAYNVTDGTVKWEFDPTVAISALNAGGGVRQVFCSPSVGSNGDIYIAARDLKNAGASRKSYMFAVQETGTQRWAFPFGVDANINYITPAIDAAGKIYIGHTTNAPLQVSVVNPATGTLDKAIPATAGIIGGLALSKSGNVYFGCAGSNGIFGYSTSSGNQVFQYNAGISGTTGGDYSIASDGTLYIVAPTAAGGVVAAIGADGTEKWKYELPGANEFGGSAIAADGTIYFAGGKISPAVSSGGIYAYAADGTAKWHFATENGVNSCTPLIDDRGYIHFVTDNSTYYIVDEQGNKVYSVKLGDKSVSSPVMDENGVIYLVYENEGVSEVAAYETGATGFANSAWPMKGGNPQRTHLQK